MPEGGDILEAQAIKVAVQLAIQAIKDEETRRKLLAVIITPVITVVLILSMAFYILTNPIEFLSSLFGNDTHTAYAQNLQNNYG